MTTDYNQGNAPFSGRVQPGGQPAASGPHVTRLLLQEEFSSGRGADGAGGFYGSQQLPARWLDWQPVSAGAAFSRYLMTQQQRAIILGTFPEQASEGQVNYQWLGSVLRNVISAEDIVWTPEDPDVPDGDALAIVKLYAGVALGPNTLLTGIAPGLLNGEYQAALIVSSVDLNAAADNPFAAIGLAAQAGDGITAPIFNVQARGQLCLDSVSPPLESNDVPLGGALGVLVRLDLILERTIDGEDTFYETEFGASISTDDGVSWQFVSSGELKGDAGDQNLPTCIGFGVTGRSNDTDSDSMGIGSFDFVRMYQMALPDLESIDLELVLLLADPNGGRNWP